MELAKYILAIIGGFVVLVWGADRFVHGAAGTARNLGISSLIIGLTIVGFGTSAPEILVSVMAAMDGSPGIAVGNALGSNIANIGLVLGSTAIIFPMVVRSQTLRREFPLMLGMMLVGFLLLYDLEITRIDGMILLGCIVGITLWLIHVGKTQRRGEPMTREFESEIPKIPLRTALIWTFVGLVLLLISSRVLVYGAVNLAQYFGVSDLIIGLTIIAIGTSLPELATSIMSAIKKEPDIVIGNIIGSNMFNLLAVLGIPAVIAPISLESFVLYRDYLVMLFLSILLFLFAYGFKGHGRINRFEGGALLACYIAYMVYLSIDVVTA